MAMRKILVVEDDEAIRRGQVDALTFAGYDVVETGDGGEVLRLVGSTKPDLVLLDVVLPTRDGFDLLDEVRRVDRTLPVIMVTARGAEADRVHGLKHGADDYVVKPFSARELLARVEAVLRRSPERPDDVTTLALNGRQVDLARREVTLADGTTRILSDKESAILRYLSTCRDRAVSREELLQRVWGLDPQGIETRTVDMHIVRLREKLGDQGSDPDERMIVTVRSKGYMLAQQVVETA